MDRTKLSLRVVSLALLLSLVLAACATPAPVVQTAVVEQAVTPSVVAATPEPKAQEPIVLTFMNPTWSDAGEAVIKEAIAAFEAENPNIKIQETLVSWAEEHSNFVTALVAGVPPDISMLEPSLSAEFQMQGAWQPAGDYLPKGFTDQFVPAALDGFVFDGQIYGVPSEGATWGFFYRTDLFEKAGLDPSKPPKNWSELVEYGKKLTVGTQYGLAIPAKEIEFQADDYFFPFLWQGDNPVAKLQGGKWVSTLNEPSAIETAKFYYDLANTYKIMSKSVVGYDWEGAEKAFCAGTAAMMYNGQWVIGALKDTCPAINGKWATAINPAGPNGTVAALGYPNVLMVAKLSKHPAEAYKFLMFLHSGSPTWIAKYALAYSTNNWTKDFVQSDFAKDPLQAPFVETMNYSHNRPFTGHLEEFRKNYFDPGIGALIRGDITPEEQCKQWDAAFNKIHAQ